MRLSTPNNKRQETRGQERKLAEKKLDERREQIMGSAGELVHLVIPIPSRNTTGTGTGTYLAFDRFHGAYSVQYGDNASLRIWKVVKSFEESFGNLGDNRD